MKSISGMTANSLFNLINSEERVCLGFVFIEKVSERRFSIDHKLGFGESTTYPLTVGYCKFVLRELRRGRTFCSTPSYT